MYTYFRALYILVPLYLVLYYFFNLYAPKRATRRKYELFAIVKANTVGLILFMTLLYIINQLDISRFVLGAFYIINIILMTLCRTMIRNILYFFRRKGYNLKYILLVGYSSAAEEYITRIIANPQWVSEICYWLCGDGSECWSTGYVHVFPCVVYSGSALSGSVLFL